MVARGWIKPRERAPMMRRGAALPRRPAERPATQQVDVQVEHRLSRLASGVRHDAVARPVEAEVRGHLGRELENLVAAYALMFVLMSWYAQRVFPTPYQWRRVATAAGAAVALLVAGELLDAGLPVALALALAYPLALAVLGFYLPFERAHLRRFVPLLR